MKRILIIAVTAGALAGCSGDDVQGMPELRLDPASLDFGAVLVGDTAELVVHASNVGGRILVLDALELLDADGHASAFFSATLTTAEVPRDGSVDVHVRFLPTAVGAARGRLRVHSNALLGTSDTVELVGAGKGRCGNGVVEPGEACDRINDGTPGHCLSGCSGGPVSPCGNGVVDAGEACDPGVPGACCTTACTPDPRCLPVAVHLDATADDAWEGFVDGAPFGSGGGWNALWTADARLTPGPHVLAVHAWDTAGVISGFIGVLHAGSATLGATGSAAWRVVAADPGAGWALAAFDDAGWAAPAACTADEVPIWGVPVVAPLVAQAQWIWSGPCRGLGSGWFRLRFTVP